VAERFHLLVVLLNNEGCVYVDRLMWRNDMNATKIAT
jgi:hypothetical protein